MLRALEFDFQCHLPNVLDVPDVVIALEQLLQLEQNALGLAPVRHCNYNYSERETISELFSTLITSTIIRHSKKKCRCDVKKQFVMRGEARPELRTNK